jgi:hypothetical protein
MTPMTGILPLICSVVVTVEERLGCRIGVRHAVAGGLAQRGI